MKELNEKLNKINNIKGQIKDSIVNKKGTITNETPFEDYPKAIDELPSGEGGEKVFAHYVDTDVAEGKRVMMTRTTNQVVPDTEFCNGHIPYFINDGIAYCSTTSGSSYSSLSKVTARPVVDGKVSNDNSVEIGNATDFTGYQPFVQSCCGGKSVVFGSYNSSSYKYPKRFGIYTGSVYKTDSVVNGYYTTITDNFFAFVDSSSSIIAKFYPLQPLQEASAALTSFKFSETNRGNMAIMFEREADKGKALYRLHSASSQNWGNCGLEKYDLETNTITTLALPYVSIETTLTHRGNISVQTKDYKYIIYPNGYIFLEHYDYAFARDNDGFAIREYPQQIKDAIGDRTVLTVQAYYGKHFALMLSDGATLMCHYELDNFSIEEINAIIASGGDFLAYCNVEEIEPFKIPDDDTIYQRLYSGDRLFWFLSTINKKSPTADKNPAGQFDKDDNTTSWFAAEPSAIRFNSTVTTGIMTGEVKFENGRKLVEVLVSAFVMPEKVMAHYNGTDIAAGKKVMLTKATDQAVQASEFCNGVTPYFINDGIAYCSTTVINGSDYISSGSARLIVDGKVQSEVIPNSTFKGFNTTGVGCFAQSCCGGKIIVMGGMYSTSASRLEYTFAFKDGNLKGLAYSSGNYMFLTEHFLITSGDAYNNGTVTKLNDLDFSTTSSPNRKEVSFSYRSAWMMAFEREEDNGTAFYRIYTENQQNWQVPYLEKYDLTTGTLSQVHGRHFFSENDKNTFGRMCVQTKDYKFLIHNNGYVFLNYFNAVISPNNNGIIFKEYPQAIQDAKGDRTIVGVQAFYDNTFSLILNDGATLICDYSGSTSSEDFGKVNAAGGDSMVLVKVTEIEPFKLPDDDTIYYRFYSENRDFWFLSTENKKAVSYQNIPAGQVDKENITSSYFAYEPSSIRFNSTVLTGFMTGESKTESGKQLVEVKTVTM